MNIALNDLVTMFKDAVVLYNDRPVKVIDINHNRQFKIWDLEKQKYEVVEWDFKKFRNPTRRLGMVNLNEGVVYVSRIPHRKYSAGLNRHNLIVEQLDADRYSNIGLLLGRMRELSDVGLADSLNNAYPSFSEAKKWVQEFYGAYAFDKQFALNTEGYVWYKTKHVGNWRPEMKQAKEIEFLPHAKHLKLLLDSETKLLRTH